MKYLRHLIDLVLLAALAGVMSMSFIHGILKQDAINRQEMQWITKR